jgi:fructokinase
VDDAGQPHFEISEAVAWDFLAWTPEWQSLAVRADAVCFGSLAQRSAESRACIRSFLQATRGEAIRIFDVNLRQHFFTVEILADSMRLANVVKLNHDELPRVMTLFEMKHLQEESSALRLIESFDLQLVCVTRGSGGSLLVTPQTYSSHPGFRVQVADTVGAGDAFTAALVHEYLSGATLGRMNDVANRVGAWVASKMGATPVPEAGDLEKMLSEVR